MARGYWRNWDETTCEECGNPTYVKDSKKYKGKILCGLCYPKAKEGEAKGKGWHESSDASGKAPDHRDAKLRAQAKGACNKPMAKKKREWTLYHGTGNEEAETILREGLKPNISAMFRAVYLTPNIKKAEEFASTKRGYKNSHDITPRTGVVFQVTITEEDFNNQLRQGTNKEVVELRKNNFDKAIAENWFEYEWYSDIPPERIKRIAAADEQQVQKRMQTEKFKQDLFRFLSQLAKKNKMQKFCITRTSRQAQSSKRKQYM